jgi:hypothetical protein
LVQQEKQIEELREKTISKVTKIEELKTIIVPFSLCFPPKDLHPN